MTNSFVMMDHIAVLLDQEIYVLIGILSCDGEIDVVSRWLTNECAYWLMFNFFCNQDGESSMWSKFGIYLCLDTEEIVVVEKKGRRIYTGFRHQCFFVGWKGGGHIFSMQWKLFFRNWSKEWIIIDSRKYYSTYYFCDYKYISDSGLKECESENGGRKMLFLEVN